MCRTFNEKFDEHSESLQPIIHKKLGAQMKKNENQKMTLFFKVVQKKRPLSSTTSNDENTSRQP